MRGASDHLVRRKDSLSPPFGDRDRKWAIRSSVSIVMKHHGGRNGVSCDVVRRAISELVKQKEVAITLESMKKRGKKDEETVEAAEAMLSLKGGHEYSVSSSSSSSLS